MAGILHDIQLDVSLAQLATSVVICIFVYAFIAVCGFTLQMFRHPGMLLSIGIVKIGTWPCL